MIDRWGPQAVLGPEPDFCTLVKATRLLNIYRIFTRKPSTLNDREKKIMGQIMLMSTQSSELDVFDVRVYELADELA